MKKKTGKTALVLWGATDLGPPHFSADILWRTGFKAPDPFILVEIFDYECITMQKDKSFLLVSPLELERAAKEAKVDEVVNLYDFQSKTRGALSSFLLKNGVTKVIVPESLPCGIKDKLAKYFKVEKTTEPFYPKRAIKTEWEVSEIEKAQRAVECAVKLAMDWLREATINFNLNGQNIVHLQRKGLHEPITSCHLRKIVDDSLYSQGYLGVDTIVACGLQAADPHCKGYGPLKPFQPIVMDVFPLSLETHYYADMTRTVFKGEPSPELKEMYVEVTATQEWAIRMVKDGVDGLDIYKFVAEHFDEVGYTTNTKTRPMEGFFHGVGHGVGLDIHEAPRISSTSDILKEGMVVTVEPGLYYHRARNDTAAIPVGGVRTEDMVLVTKSGCRNLTKFPKDLESMIIP